MTYSALAQRLEILYQQDRYQASRELLESYLADNPDDAFAALHYVQTLVNLGEIPLARKVIEPLIEDNPDDPIVLELAARIELADNKPVIAERFARMLIDMDARNADAFALMAQCKMTQRNYDAVLYYAAEALAIDPEHTGALNLKIYADSLLGNNDGGAAVGEALHVDPENVSTIANHAYQLLSQGKTKEALERARHALSLNPSHPMARMVMLECLRAQNPGYRLYFKYTLWMSRLSSGMAMAVVFGAWIAVNYLSQVAAANPEWATIINPPVYIAVAAFIFTWVARPLSNLYLLANRYGRVLLNLDQKLMAGLTGVALGCSLLALLAHFLWPAGGQWLFVAILCAMLMIPLGSFLSPTGEQYRRVLTAVTIGLVILSVLSVFVGTSLVLYLTFAGFIGYQLLVNVLASRESGRTFGD